MSLAIFGHGFVDGEGAPSQAAVTLRAAGQSAGIDGRGNASLFEFTPGGTLTIPERTVVLLRESDYTQAMRDANDAVVVPGVVPGATRIMQIAGLWARQPL